MGGDACRAARGGSPAALVSGRAAELLPQLGILNTLQYLNHDGLTGSLSLNENGEVERQQPRAIIRNEKVEILTE